MFHVTHALIIANAQGQKRSNHGAAVNNVAVKQLDGVSDFHQVSGFVNFIDQRINAAGKIIGGGNIHIGASGTFCGKMRSRFKVAAKTCFWFHDVSNQHVATASNQAFFGEG